MYPRGGYLARQLKSKKLDEFFDSMREGALDRIENKRVKWCRVDGKLPKLDVAGSIPVSRSIFSTT